MYLLYASKEVLILRINFVTCHLSLVTCHLSLVTNHPESGHGTVRTMSTTTKSTTL